MSDTPPLIFEKRLGALFPANPDAAKAMENITGSVRVEIKKTRGNNKRMDLYWVVLGRVAPVLSDLCEGDALTSAMLHRILKDRAGLYTETVLPSGEVFKNYDSISFHTMTEPERAEFIDWALMTLSKWTGISIDAMTEDERQRA